MAIKWAKTSLLRTLYVYLRSICKQDSNGPENSADKTEVDSPMKAFQLSWKKNTEVLNLENGFLSRQKQS